MQLCSRLFVHYLCCALDYQFMELQALINNFTPYNQKKEKKHQLITKHPSKRACKAVKKHTESFPNVCHSDMQHSWHNTIHRRVNRNAANQKRAQ